MHHWLRERQPKNKMKNFFSLAIDPCQTSNGYNCSQNARCNYLGPGRVSQLKHYYSLQTLSVISCFGCFVSNSTLQSAAILFSGENSVWEVGGGGGGGEASRISDVF